jgi:hypothetical protein
MARLLGAFLVRASGVGVGVVVGVVVVEPAYPLCPVSPIPGPSEEGSIPISLSTIPNRGHQKAEKHRFPDASQPSNTNDFF